MQKRNGNLMFLAGLALLLFSWIAERALNEHYQPRIDDMTRAMSDLQDAMERTKINLIAVDLARFQTGFQRVELKKLNMQAGNDSARKERDEQLQSLLKKQDDLTAKAEIQANRALQDLRDALPKLVPDKADEFGERFKAMSYPIQSSGQSLPEALRGNLAPDFAAWQRDLLDENSREELDARERVRTFKYLFMFLYVIGSVAVITGESMRAEWWQSPTPGSKPDKKKGAKAAVSM